MGLKLSPERLSTLRTGDMLALSHPFMPGLSPEPLRLRVSSLHADTVSFTVTYFGVLLAYREAVIRGEEIEWRAHGG